MNSDKPTLETVQRLIPPEYWNTAADYLDGFIEQPVTMRQFLDDPKYLGATECWPVVRQDLIDLFDSPTRYLEAVFDEGIGSGKSYKVSCIFSYMLYVLQCFRDPQKSLHLAPGSIIALMNMSSNASQAKKVVFNEVKNRIEQCRWFKAHGVAPDPNVMSELRFPKNIVIMPGNSSSTFPLGYNLFCGVLDEAAFYTDSDSHDLADEIHDSLMTRIRSRFGEQGMLCTISSPRYVDDFIEQLMAYAKDNPRIFARRRATWESKTNWRGGTFEAVHPSTSALVSIPVELKESFERNPEKAWRDFGAVPSLVLEPYLRDRHKIETAMTGQNFNINYPWQSENSDYAIHVDLARSGDACGVAVGRLDGDTVVIECVAQLVSRVQMLSRNFPNGTECGVQEIDFDEVRNKILKLRDGFFPIMSVSYDGWQSYDSQQLLTKEGLNVQEISVDRNMRAYDTLKELLYGGRLILPKFPQLYNELIRLELKDGKKVDHPPKGRKDVADAVAGVCWALIGNQMEGKVVEETTIHQEEALGEERDEAMPRIGADW